jgi:hypothetical protein
MSGARATPEQRDPAFEEFDLGSTPMAQLVLPVTDVGDEPIEQFVGDQGRLDRPQARPRPA